MFPDARMLTEPERQKLCKMLFYALLEIRGLGNAGKGEQAADLADAFHNLPAYLWSNNFSFRVFREYLAEYRQRYPERETSYDYIKLLDEIMKKDD
jgi:hypothetical protein